MIVFGGGFETFFGGMKTEGGPDRQTEGGGGDDAGKGEEVGD